MSSGTWTRQILMLLVAVIKITNLQINFIYSSRDALCCSMEVTHARVAAIKVQHATRASSGANYAANKLPQLFITTAQSHSFIRSFVWLWIEHTQSPGQARPGESSPVQSSGLLQLRLTNGRWARCDAQGPKAVSTLMLCRNKQTKRNETNNNYNKMAKTNELCSGQLLTDDKILKEKK